MRQLILGTVSFGWALLSMLVGMAILVTIGLKVWSEVGELRREREARAEGEEEGLADGEKINRGDGGGEQESERKERDE